MVQFKSFDGPVEGQDKLHTFFADDCFLRTTLIEAKMWFADPKGFNDPFDCNLPVAKSHSRAKLWAYLSKQEPDWVRMQYINRINEFLLNPDENSFDYGNQLYRLGIGVRCFTKTNDDILMWAHYGKNHTGACLTFDLKKDESFFTPKDTVAVSYREGFTDYDFINYGSQHEKTQLADQTKMHYIGIKANAWKYEDEVRLVKEDKTVLLYARSIESQTKSFKEVYTKTEAHIKQKESDGLINRKYCFKRGALVEISFGCNSTQRSIEEIRSILNEYGYKTKLKKAKPNLSKFGLKFNDC